MSGSTFELRPTALVREVDSAHRMSPDRPRASHRRVTSAPRLVAPGCSPSAPVRTQLSGGQPALRFRASCLPHLRCLTAPSLSTYEGTYISHSYVNPAPVTGDPHRAWTCRVDPHRKISAPVFSARMRVFQLAAPRATRPTFLPTQSALSPSPFRQSGQEGPYKALVRRARRRQPHAAIVASALCSGTSASLLPQSASMPPWLHTAWMLPAAEALLVRAGPSGHGALASLPSFAHATRQQLHGCVAAVTTAAAPAAGRALAHAVESASVGPARGICSIVSGCSTSGSSGAFGTGLAAGGRVGLRGFAAMPTPEKVRAREHARGFMGPKREGERRRCRARATDVTLMSSRPELLNSHAWSRRGGGCCAFRGRVQTCMAGQAA
eukprot:364879-Chlamydomonas_euryale.AAC.4